MSLKSLVVSLGLGAALASSSGCVTRGYSFSSDYDWLREGKTTQSEVYKVLGKPYHVGYSSGKPTWTYGFYKFRLFGETHTKELKIYWDQKVVDSFSFNSSFPEDKRYVLSKLPN